MRHTYMMPGSGEGGAGASKSTPPSPPLAATMPQPPPHHHRSQEQQRLHVSFQEDRKYLTQMLALESTRQRNVRVESILELKQDLDASSAQLQAQSASVQRRAKELSDQEKRTHQQLLNQGKNPHEVARKQHVQQAAHQERRHIEARIQEKQVQILNRLEVEKVLQQRRDRLAQEQQAFDKKYQAEMGRSAVEARTKAYVLAKTGKDQLDPTGKAVRVYPSQETTMKDHSFGLGKNLVHTTAQRKAIVDKVHAKGVHHGAVANAMLLPRQNSASGSNNNTSHHHPGSVDSSRSSSANNDSRDAASPSETNLFGAMGPVLPIPGQDLREVNHKLLPVNSAEHLLPPINRSSSASDTSSSAIQPKKGFGTPKLSVLEQQMLVKAREKQKANIFQKQVVWGKEFRGDAFLADPPLLWFKDFDVGTPLVLTFTLTNVSNTFNHFRLTEMDENIREYFEITYERPGRMSAGMSCTIRMSFTAMAPVDLETYLPALAQTGAFRIPVRCTCKKAVPVLSQREIEFCEVVAGDKKTITVTLENRGALPLYFRVKPATDSDVGPEVDDLGEEAEELALETTADDADQAANGGTGEEVESESGIDDESVVSPAACAQDPAMGNPNDASEDGELAVDGDLVTVTRSSVEGHEPFSAEEQAILEYAESFTVYKPKGFESPLHHTKNGVVAPYSSTPIAFTFTPASPMRLVDQVFAIEFAQEGASKRRSGIAPLSLVVSAESTQVPIFTAEEMLDVGCCAFDKLYRHQLVICNRGKVALKIQLRAPKVLDGFVEFTPTMGYVQGAATHSASASNVGKTAEMLGKFVIQVKFRPQPEIWRRIERKGFGNEAVGFLAVPVQVIVPDQVVPVFFVLVARLTVSGLLFSMDRIGFGNCPLGYSVYHMLTIENTARLPQHFGFMKLPPDIRVEDSSDGVGGTLLPSEKKTLKLVYQPSTATPMQTKLCVRTSLNREYYLPCSGNCLATPLAFSHNLVRLGATQVGQSQTFSIVCANSSEKAQSFELRLPEGAEKFLRLSPLVSRVEPNGSVRIEIEFSPTEALFDFPEASFEALSPPARTSRSVGDERKEEDSTGMSVAQSTAPAASVVVNQSKTRDRAPLRNLLLPDTGGTNVPPWQSGIPAEEKSVHHKWTVLCFRRAETAKEGRSTMRNIATPPLPLLAIQVETTTIEPKLLTLPSKLDFNQVAIGQSLVMDIRLTNDHRADVVLRSKPLHALGGFRMVNSLRPIRSGETRTIKMEFKPQSPIIYEDELQLSSLAIGTVKIPLRGEGINPSLSIQPADGWLDFKDVLARSKSVLELVLANAGSFPLTYSIAPWPEHTEAMAASNGLPVFTFTPCEAIIPAQDSLAVKVAFNPALQRPDHYTQQFRIQVPNESEKHLLTLAGRCWEDQLYVFSPALLDLPLSAKTIRASGNAPLLAPPPIEDPFDLPPNINLTQLASSSTIASLFTAGLRKSQSTITIAFDDEERSASPLTRHLMIGSTLSPSDDESHLSAVPTGKPAASSASPVGSFELAFVENAAHPEYAKLFSLEPMKGALTAGQQVQVHATYHESPTAGDHDAAEVALCEKQKDLTVSQWIQVQAVCTLRGGFLWRQLPQLAGGSQSGNQRSGGGAADSESRTVQIILRAKLQS